MKYRTQEDLTVMQEKKRKIFKGKNEKIYFMFDFIGPDFIILFRPEIRNRTEWSK